MPWDLGHLRDTTPLYSRSFRSSSLVNNHVIHEALDQRAYPSHGRRHTILGFGLVFVAQGSCAGKKRYAFVQKKARRH